MSFIDTVRGALLPAGLNLISALPVERYDRDVPESFHLSKRHPDGKSLVVIGNGGRAFWDGFRTYREKHRDFAEREAHPLDAYTMMVIESLLPPLLRSAGVSGRILYPFDFAREPVSFLHLGAMAGLGARSLLGVLVHPEFGPWIALRAALLLNVELEPSPVVPFDPCGGCVDKPCLTACPARAVSERGWDVPACTAHRVGDAVPDASQPDSLSPRERGRVRGENDEARPGCPHPNPLPGGEGTGEQREQNCGHRCEARWHCVYGREHRYPADALAYHQRRALETMRARYAA
jgi:NAD-dependent dihydropyrimidine dehydrogenase PreA subunit